MKRIQASFGTNQLGRRQFLKLGMGTGFAVYAMAIDAQTQSAAVEAGLMPQQQPSAFVSIDGDGFVTVTIGKTDIGQGVQTALPMLVAEELDADWSKVRSHLGPAGEAYKDPVYKMQIVGGSTTMKHSWSQYREIGARMRAMLVNAAAKRLNVSPSVLKTQAGMVIAPDGRSLSYGELAAAALDEPVPTSVELKSPAKFKLIGKPTGRLDARDKSSGLQIFGIDFTLPHMRTVVILHPPVFGAKVLRYDATKAKAISGIEDVYQVPLYNGGVGLAVVADGFWPARLAREVLQVEWDTDGVEKADSDTLWARYRVLAGQPGTKVHSADTSALANTKLKKISAEYTFPYLAHTPMEPLNCSIDFRGDHCTVWVGSQLQTADQAAVAHVLGLKPDQVTLNTMMAGGGFGRRAVPTSDYLVDAAQVAKARYAVGRREPIKMIWTREDDVRGGYYRPMHLHRVEIAHDGKGTVLAWKHIIVGQSITSGTQIESFTVKNGVDETMVEGVAGSPYPFPIALEVHHPKVNVPVLWFRSVGHTHTAFVMETLVDELARAGGIDPVTYRRRLLAKHPRNLAAMELAVEKSGYGKRRLPPGRAWGVAVHESFDSTVAYVVEVSMNGTEPVLHMVTAAVHCNMPVNPRTIEAQMQGGLLMGLGMTIPGAEITLKDGLVQQHNWNDYRIPTHAHMPKMTVHIVPSADPPTGIGEPSLPPIAPAMANAIAAITGRRHRSLPFSIANPA